MLNTKGFVPLDVIQKEKEGSLKNGILTIVCSASNGKRLLFSDTLVEALHLEDSVKLGFVKGTLIVGKNLPGQGNCFHLRNNGKKKVLYSSPVVQAIAEQMQIDFSGSVSYTFYDVEMDEHKSYTIAMFNKEER